MSFDSTLRAFAVLACLYTIGLFVTVTSSAALEAVTHKPQAACSVPSCGPAARHHLAPVAVADMSYARAIHSAAMFLAGESSLP